MLLVLAVLVILNQAVYLAEQIGHKGRYFEDWVAKHGYKGKIIATGGPKEVGHLFKSLASAIIRAGVIVFVPAPVWLKVYVAIFASTHVANLLWYLEYAEKMLTDNVVPPMWLKLLTIFQAIVSIAYLSGWIFVQYVRPLFGQ